MTETTLTFSPAPQERLSNVPTVRDVTLPFIIEVALLSEDENLHTTAIAILVNDVEVVLINDQHLTAIEVAGVVREAVFRTAERIGDMIVQPRGEGK